MNYDLVIADVIQRVNLERLPEMIERERKRYPQRKTGADNLYQAVVSLELIKADLEKLREM